MPKTRKGNFDDEASYCTRCCVGARDRDPGQSWQQLPDYLSPCWQSAGLRHVLLLTLRPRRAVLAGTFTRTGVTQTKMKTKTKILIAAAAGLAVITLWSPIVEGWQDTIVYDAALTKTCYDRYGLNFFSRWSCRSSLRQIGMFGVAMTCGLNNSNGDFCTNLKQMSVENKRDPDISAKPSQDKVSDDKKRAADITAKLPQDKVAAIKRDCAGRWENNFEMREFCENQQYEALQRMIDRGSVKPSGERL